MPIKHNALRQIRKDRRRANRNQANRSELRTLRKRFLSLVEEKKADDAKALLPQLMRQFDRAASKGLIHRNTASRAKSRLSKRLASTK